MTTKIEIGGNKKFDKVNRSNVNRRITVVKIKKKVAELGVSGFVTQDLPTLHYSSN